jgi:PadR family transcriptional regulator, regulatory protein PadR
MRRRAGHLVPLERAICEAAARLRQRGTAEIHGYLLAKEIKQVTDTRLLTAYGTLYRALGRLEAMGLLQSRNEDPEIAAREHRPGRRLYALTAAGDRVLEEAAREDLARSSSRKRWVPA